MKRDFYYEKLDQDERDKFITFYVEFTTEVTA
jgi:hypothetical protein